MVAPALVAGAALGATVVNMRFVKPIDAELLAEIAASHDALVTVEEHVVAGGAGSACAEALAQAGFAKPMLHLGLPDRFIDHGDHALLLKWRASTPQASKHRCAHGLQTSSRPILAPDWLPVAEGRLLAFCKPVGLLAFCGPGPVFRR
jgi:deoxyxylulose-5-phosphate synthase